ncbi:ABC transporter permease [Tomitella biformata]|uniref:ABC transporter permease n=1 Tax=Tomitella biformata TaxID=630403 RepID=UPI0004651447|nr:ABC transporter permease [Tomitella biformata]
MSTPNTLNTSALRTIALVSQREFTTRARTKSFLISNALILALMIGGLIVTSIFVGGDSKPDVTKVGLVGSAQQFGPALTAAGPALGLDIQTVDLSAEEARTQAGDETVAVALVSADDGAVTALTDKSLDTDLHSLLDGVVRAQATDAALTAQNVDQAKLQSDTEGAVVTVEAINPPNADEGQRLILAAIGAGLLFMGITVYGVAVGVGVVEEKSSRVVEVLLSTIKPLHLLWGKIFGLGAIGLLQVALVSVAGLVTGLATGLITVTGTATAVLIAVLVWYVLGFIFFAVLYAAGGSMVSRQEEVNSTTMPITLLVMAMVYVAFFGINSLDSTFMTVMSWIPPFSATVMPMRIAAGLADPVQIVVTVLLMIAACFALSIVAAKIYQRSVLQTGSKVSLRQALGR